MFTPAGSAHFIWAYMTSIAASEWNSADISIGYNRSPSPSRRRTESGTSCGQEPSRSASRMRNPLNTSESITT
jgi:hypothetical protein